MNSDEGDRGHAFARSFGEAKRGRRGGGISIIAPVRIAACRARTSHPRVVKSVRTEGRFRLFRSAVPGIGLSLLLPMVLTRAAESPETAGGWRKYEGNPVLGGSLGTCFDVAVLKEGGKDRMWFSWRPKQSVALVESSDGIHWGQPEIVLGPNRATHWEEDINRPVVVHRGDGYHMWYTGQTQSRSYLGYARSADGRTWNRVSPEPVLSPDVAWEKVAVMCPHVIWDESVSVFRMWYSGGEQYEPDAIGYATSSNGVVWAKSPANPIFKSDSSITWESHKVTACQVERRDGWYVMFYIGFRDIHHAQIGIARSRDGISNWQRLPANPVIKPGAHKWDQDACYKPFAIFDGAKWLLWYNGRSGSVEQIGLAYHEGVELGF